MTEVGTAVTELDFSRHSEIAGHFAFKQPRYLHLRHIDLTVLEVEKSGTDKLCCHEALVMGRCCCKFLNERIGDHFTGLVVTGVGLEQFRFQCPVFVDLRGKLNKIAVYISPA